MASSGTVNAPQSGTRPYLRINWSILNQDVSNNRSRVRLQLVLVATHNTQFSASKAGSNNGSSFTYTGGFSGTGTRTLNTRDIWVNHNSDGTRTQSVSGSLNLNISWGDGNIGTISVSGNMNLDSIPRASTVSNFKNFYIRHNSQTTIEFEIDRKHNSFTHVVELRLNGTPIQSWTGQGTPTSLNTFSPRSNQMLEILRNVEYSTACRLKVTTFDSNGNYVGEDTDWAHARVHPDEVPTASTPSSSIFGSGRDNSIGKYVQNISRASLSFNHSLAHGTTLSSRSITIERTNGSDRTTISGGSGTSNTLRQAGTYRITARVTDSRGRSASATRDITVHTYNPPQISLFTATRNSDIPTTVNIVREGLFSHLSGDNPLTISLQRRQGTGSWSNVRSNVTSTTGVFTGGHNQTGVSVLQSYEYRVVVTDTFGNNADASQTVSTQEVVLDIHKDIGVGIMKLHEQGALDVGGLIYMLGDKVTAESSGSNSSGDWIRYDNGLQICWGRGTYDRNSSDLMLDTPAEFIDRPTCAISGRSTGFADVQDMVALGYSTYPDGRVRVMRTTRIDWRGDGTLNFNFYLIGWWK